MTTRRSVKRAAAALPALPASPELPTAAAMTAKLATASTSQIQVYEINSWEDVDIKLEMDDVTDSNLLLDVKPDVHNLQRDLVLQQQSLQQQTLPSQQPPQQQQIQLTPIIQPPLPNRSLFKITQVGTISDVPCSCRESTLTPPPKKARTTPTTTTATIVKEEGKFVPATGACSATNTTVSKFLENAIPKDEVDLQESDLDEDGYSDIDFDDDDELIEDDDETDIYDPTWTDKPTVPRMVFNFNRTLADTGLQGRPRSTKPLFYLAAVLGNIDTFFILLAESSNQRVRKILELNGFGLTSFNPINGDEMKIFFCLCLEMSAMKFTTIEDYWTAKAHCGFKGFGWHMKLSRFQLLLRSLNFNALSEFEQSVNVEEAEEQQKEQPKEETQGVVEDLKPLLSFFNQRMETIYKCGQRLVLNEPILFWKGKLNWLRDFSDKFRSNAVWLHFLTEKTGLVLNIVLDVKKSEPKLHARDSKSFAVERIGIANQLLRYKLGMGHTVYGSKYYSSYGLANELSNQQTYCTGFLDNKRYGNSKQIILTKLKPNPFVIKYAPPVMMGKCRRRQKYAYFLSSDCLAIYATECMGTDPRPKIIKELDWQLETRTPIREHMINYQLSLDRKEIKWEKQVAIYIFNLMVLNAYLFFTRYSKWIPSGRGVGVYPVDINELKTYEDFRREIIASLLEPFKKKANDEEQLRTDKTSTKGAQSENGDEWNTTAQESVTQNNITVTNNISSNNNTFSVKVVGEIEHLPKIIPCRNGKAMKKKCRICRKGGMLTLTKVYCSICPGNPGLCDAPCFKIWHDHLKLIYVEKRAPFK